MHPTLHQIQGVVDQGKNDKSALEDNFVEIECQINNSAGPFADDHGQLVVTGIFNEGYFISDMADRDPSGGYKNLNHLYIYNYNYPEDLEVGDRLDRLEGTAQDFSGCTQITFPSWSRAVDESHNPKPFHIEDLDNAVPPELITRDMCGDSDPQGSRAYEANLCGHNKNDWSLEVLESGRVRLEFVKTPEVFVNCDFNGDQKVTAEWADKNSLEAHCNMMCLKYDTRDDLVKDYETIVAREVVAKPEVLQQIAENTCSSNNDCSSGQCGGYTDQDKDDGICRTICPWEAAIQNIQPNCMEIKIANEICSELVTLRQFGQYAVSLENGTGPQFNVMTRESLPEFDPTAQENLGTIIEYLQGNLRQIRAARPRWMLLVGQEPMDAPELLKP